MTEKSSSEPDFKPELTPCPSCGVLYEKNQPWKLLCLRCYLKTKTDSGIRLVPGTPPAIEPTMLKRLIQLCHPDRHQDSEASNKATAWLLAQRGGQHG